MAVAVRYLIDTCTCADFMRERSTSLQVRFREQSLSDLAISAITLAELEFGLANSRHPEQNATALRNFCAGIQILSFDTGAAAAYGRLRAELKVASITIGPLDLLIAAHALSEEAVIVTNNEREFRRVPGLTVENWL